VPQKVPTIPIQGLPPTTPNIVVEQLKDKDVALILMLRSQSSKCPDIQEILGASEKV